MSIRKVEPFAGAMWVIDGIKLWWRDLRGLGFLGLLLGVLGVFPNLVAGIGANITTVAIAQLACLLFSALVVLALFFAAREVDEGRSGTPAQLARTLQEGRTGRLMAGVLLPQLLAMLICGALLGWIVGFEEFERLMVSLQQLQRDAKNGPPHALVAPLLGRFIVWMGLALVVVAAIGLLTFTLLPDMIFGNRSFVDALRRSVSACFANIPAMILFGMAIVGVAIACFAILGPTSMLLIPLLGAETAGLLINILIIAIIFPISINAMYLGWKQMFGASSADAESATTGKDRVAM